MRPRTGLLVLAAAGFAFLWRGASSEPSAGASPLKVEMVGEGTVSTADDEFGGALSPDGRTLYYDLTVPPHSLYVLVASPLIAGRWGVPEVLPFSGEWRDSDPVLSPDGKTLYFASDRPVAGADPHRFLIWATELKAGGGWRPPHPLSGGINKAGSQVFASVAANGNMYFTSNRQTGAYDVYRARWRGGQYLEPEDLGPTVNGDGIWSLEAWVSPDESYLLIGSFGRDPGFGNSDLYISYREGPTWSRPRNLGPEINTRAREYSPRVSPDGQWLFFTSERGVQTEARERPLSHDEFVQRTRGILNGLGNIYRVPMASVLDSTRP